MVFGRDDRRRKAGGTSSSVKEAAQTCQESSSSSGVIRGEQQQQGQKDTNAQQSTEQPLYKCLECDREFNMSRSVRKNVTRGATKGV